MNKPRGQPFEPGNKIGRGRPKGRKNNVTLECRKLLEEYAAPLFRKCIMMALQGDMPAMRLCVERLLPAERDSKIYFQAGSIRTMADLLEAGEQIWGLIAKGKLTPAEAEQLSSVLEPQRERIEATEFEKRISVLEQAQKQETEES